MFQNDLLKGRTILITGGGTGLGRSMALRFAELGARMYLVGRREEPLKEVCSEIHRAGGSRGLHHRPMCATTAPLKPPPKGRATSLIASTPLINNAAGNFIARTEKLSPNAFNAVVSIVLNGSFHCTLKPSPSVGSRSSSAAMS